MSAPKTMARLEMAGVALAAVVSHSPATRHTFTHFGPQLVANMYLPLFSGHRFV